ncbi:GNAT family N-acetyltransferase [Micromonospora sp. NPDC047074]|uniref:GNAT family N-acetyltransferase n=1 Tax=Micromonospora sp. NPDC047074 TaxID=3154339 RepID=UPI0033D463CC
MERDISVQTAGPTHLDAIIDLWRAAGHRRSATDNVESLAAVLAHPNATILVALDGRTLVGSALPAWDGWRATVYRVVLHPRWQEHEEIGLTLIAAAVKWLSQFGVETVGAPVGGTAEAQRLWKRAGFRHDAQTHRFVHDIDVNGDES